MLKTTLKSSVLGSTALALTLAAAFSAPANAQPNGVYAGGATFPEKVYRDIMNCYGSTSGGDLLAALSPSQEVCGSASPYRSTVEILYVGVGSGNGLAAFVNHNPRTYNAGKVADKPPVVGTTDLGSFYGSGTGAGWTPVANTGNAYPKVSFTGSDDPETVASYGTYHSNTGGATANGWGELIQVPSLVGAVAVPYKPTAGTWTEHGKKPTGATAAQTHWVDLSTQTLCGIYSGVITDWSNSEITTDNGGVQLGSGTIHPLYRAEGSGTTFLFVNGLINQCSGTAHPVNPTWQTASGNATGISNNNWFLNVEAAGLIPANFIKVSGSGGMKNTTGTSGTPGAIGYVSTDFVFPYDSTGPFAAAIQSYASLVAGGAHKWVLPTPKTATAIFSGTPGKAPLFTAGSCPTGSNTTLNGGAISPIGTDKFDSTDGICAHNPLNWGAANPKPASAAAYPIGGFTFVNLYTCYASATDVSDLAGTTAGSLGYFRWFFGSATDNAGIPKASMTLNGFSAVPGPWLSGAKKLITSDQKTKVSVPGTVKTGCAAVTGTGA